MLETKKSIGFKSLHPNCLDVSHVIWKYQMSTNVSKILTYYLIQSYLSKKKQIFYASVNDTFPGKFMCFSEAGTGSVLWKKLYLQISKYLQESWRPATLLKIDSNKGVFLWILRSF